MAIDKYSQLKIAGNVMQMPIGQMANELGVTLQTVKGVCRGTITSARVSAYVENKIDEAEKLYDKHRREKSKLH